MTDTAKLKAAAEKATPGPWRRTSTIFNGITYGPFSLTNEKVLANVAEKANAEFIAAANPAAVLELIAALEAAEKRGTDMEVACELFAESKLAQIKLEAALGIAQQRLRAG
ncbi:ead/Ea22-like family protein [Cronobacter sakazakii]|uniref:ead/Ea22-like family protein n=1 Tax=Cronobacter sakazakii TaxID=28141 RepID=UPI0027B7A36D|nr:ead/Ea22-like family protein [Cronobacter sakazakii]MDQ1954303.1 ead/Ea22-like family protein [Cronobacter sakazakii]